MGFIERRNHRWGLCNHPWCGKMNVRGERVELKGQSIRLEQCRKIRSDGTGGKFRLKVGQSLATVH